MKEILPGLWDIDEIGSMVHAYAWQWNGQVTLIDTGTPGNGDRILDALQSVSIAPEQLTRIIITHGDVDHMGSLRSLVRATGAHVVCHTVEKALLQHPERRRPAANLGGYLVRPVMALLRLLPAFRAEPVTPDELVVDGQKLPEGFTVIHTPGHTPGHISLLHRGRRLLIAGDALNRRTGTLDGPPALFTPDMENARRSIERLGHKLGGEYDVAVFGHGDPLLSGAGAAVQALADRLVQTPSRTPR